MSDTSTEAQGGEKTAATPDANEFQPITSQEDLNKVIKDRIERERAKFSDYGDLRQKAAKYDEVVAANQTELERATSAAAQAEERAKQAEVQMTRFRVAAKYGVSDEDADLFLTGTDEESLVRQAERLAARNAEATSPRAPRPDANQGRSGAAGPKTTADSFAEFFRQNLNER